MKSSYKESSSSESDSEAPTFDLNVRHQSISPPACDTANELTTNDNEFEDNGM